MNPTGFVFFVAIIIGTLVITYYASQRMINTNDFYAAGHELNGIQNGFAIAGDYMSAASFLGITGSIALYGYDGFFYSIGFFVSYLVLLLVVAEPLHNLGKFTVADAVHVRFRSRRLRGVIALNTLSISVIYMIAQLVGAGALIHLLLNINNTSAILIVGILMTTYVVFGGMIATSWVQIIKSILLLAGTLIMSLIIFSRFGWSLQNMFSSVTTATPLGEKFLQPGNQYDNPIDTLSFNLALILGTAGLPHILVRLFTVKETKTARFSVVTATGVIGVYYIMTIFLGFGAASFVGWQQLEEAGYAGNLAAPLLAHALGGEFLMAFISAVAFATILAVVSGLVLSASSAFAHDFYSSIFRRGTASEKEQMYAAKLSSIGVGLISIVLAIGAQKLNVAFLVALAFAVAASANLPMILLMLFWKKFNPTGAIIGILTGLASSIILVLLSPNVMDPVDGWIRVKAVFPLENPGIISIPLGFAGAILGTWISGKAGDQRYDRFIFQAMTGMKPEK